ncbi:MAG: hypothetical protein NTZ16_05975 [Verrucomicrobia bacterium]|nr:hypothetical protein [Verrucomicrobiota bacterium]
MKPHRRKLCFCLLLLGAAGGVVLARPPTAPDPVKAFRLQVSETYLQTDVEVFREEQQTTTPSQTTSRERIIVQPAVGIGLEGSVYHPNLLHYRIGAELGMDWQSSRMDAQSGTSSSFLQRYHLSLDLLRNQPYAMAAFADKDLTYRDYDFFTRVRVDSTRYGARAGYNTGPVPFNVSYTHYDEQVTELARPTQTTEEMLNFSAANNRRDDRAHSQLFYNLNQYTRQGDGFGTERGLCQNVSLSDSENFGAKDWIQLLSLLDYNALSVRRYGAAVSEQYSRHLGSWGNLALGYSGGVDREERRSTGVVLRVINEPHTLMDGVLSLLNQPAVDLMSIQVTDSSGTVHYHETFDYRILPHGTFTEIQRVTSFGSAITNGTPVLVTYNAAQQPSAAYASVNNGVNFRIDFWNGRLGLYGRWTKLDYYGGDGLVLDAMDNKLIGVDTSWRWFRAGVEYEVADSRFAPYNRTRAYQSANFQPSLDATLGIDFDESWITHRDTQLNQTAYSAIVRYQQQLWMSLAWRVEGGMVSERGGGYDRDTATARAGLDWEIGKLMLKLGYEYNNENYSTDVRTRHYLFLRARRNFL